ncbi:MAG: hypothetical protein U1E70_21055 [Acetobacteraceae bacterium]
MHLPAPPAPSRTNPPARSLLNILSVVMLALVVGFVLFVALRSPLKDDIAWLLYVARRWMAGRELYIDVIEVNPPLIIWLSAIPLGIAQRLGFDVQMVTMPFFTAVVLACVWWSSTLLRSIGGIFAHRLPVFTAMAAVFLLIPAGELGQREHLLVAAFLPYLILLAQRLDGRQTSVVASIVAGILAGLGCALKPRYGAMFAVLECLALLYGLRPWRVMPFAAGLTVAAYAGLVALLCPAYLRHAVPMALALYGATDVPMRDLLAESAMLIGGIAVATVLLWLRRRRPVIDTLMLSLLVFAATSTVICFVDGKDWFYHRLPATITTILALLLWITRELRDARPRRIAIASAALAAGVFCFNSAQRLQPEVLAAIEPRTTTVQRLEGIIRAEHAHTYIAFSEWIALGFPVVNETGVAWASRFDSMWALKGEIWRASFDPTASREWPVARWVAHDFIAGCPDIAVVDTRETTNYLKVLRNAEPAFARAWSRYRQIAAFDGLVVYRRGKGGCLDVWVAAESSRPTLRMR